MANTEKVVKKDIKPLLLLIACGVLLLALIVVSAFAYQWHNENIDLKKSNTTLRALTDSSTLNSVTQELSTVQQDLMAAQSDKAYYEKLSKEYEAILEENNLMPASTAEAE